MKIDDIQPGKKYWKVIKRTNGRMLIKEVIVNAVYVLEVDRKKVRVLASLNGTPAEWFVKTAFARWTCNNPIK